MTLSFVPRTDLMTNHRRLRRFAAACAIAPGLLAGCANSSQFTAGRLPYGGEGGTQTASAAGTPQDPFAARGTAAGAVQPAAGQQGFDAAAFAQHGGAPTAPAGQQPPATGFVAQGSPQMGTAQHQAAYPQQDGNPFAQASAEESAFAGDAQWATFETPAAPAAESNPFAEIQGQPAVSRAVAPEPLPTITPAGGSGSRWQPEGQVATAPAADEFLPPVQ